MKRLQQRDANFYWLHSSLLASTDITEFQTIEANTSSDLSGGNYNVYVYLRDEKENVKL
jgi:hypothetical protein